MTYDSTRPAPVSAEGIARAVEGVPGVAFLRPGLVGRLRPVPDRSARPQAGRDRAPTAGIRLSRPGRAGDVPGAEAGAGAGTEAGPGSDAGPWHVEIHLVARRQARALDVARAVRRGVEAYLLPRSPAGAAPAHVTVTVTGQV